MPTFSRGDVNPDGELPVVASAEDEDLGEPVFEGYEGLDDKIYDAEGEEAQIRLVGEGWIRAPRSLWLRHRRGEIRGAVADCPIGRGWKIRV